MARYFLTLSYDGTNFNGWQIQKNTANTVEQVLEEKLTLLLGEKIEIVGCGRTDTGVSARDYVAHFDSTHHDLEQVKKNWIHKFNNALPPAIAVKELRMVNNKSHARYDATQRVYYYYITQKKDPFKRNYSHYIHEKLDFDKMNQAALLLKTHSDFTSFSKLHTQNKTNLCKISKAVWLPCGEEQWLFTISADRFLRGMVRAIVGTLLLVGRGKMTVAQFAGIIEARDRKAAGFNVPAKALILVAVKYPKELFIG